ncbi:MAG: hypothetical protein D6776_09110 [Planctomycetota bacterium]|nr:MAG: hypothetical protein D6776_09110 [Planctomycetota bacterium]
MVVGTLCVLAGGLGATAALRGQPAVRAESPGDEALERQLAAFGLRLARLEQRQPAAPIAARATGDNESLRERVAALERRLAAIEQALETRAVAAGVSRAGAPDPAGLQAGIDDGQVATAAGARAAAADPIPPVIEKAVRRALEAERRQQEEEEQARAELRRLQRAERQVERIAERLALTDEQRSGFVALLLERDEARGALWRKVRDGEIPFEQAREQRELLWKAYDEKVRTLLAPAQYAELEKIRAEREQGGPRGGRRLPQ